MQSLLRTTDLLRSRHAAAARLFPAHHKHNPSSASASAYYPLGDDDNNGDGRDDGDEHGDDHGDGTNSADVVPEYEYHDMARAGLGSWGVAVRFHRNVPRHFEKSACLFETHAYHPSPPRGKCVPIHAAACLSQIEQACI